MREELESALSSTCEFEALPGGSSGFHFMKPLPRERKVVPSRDAAIFTVCQMNVPYSVPEILAS